MAGPLLVEKQKADLGKGNEYTFAVALDRTACREGHIEIVGAGPGDPDLISIRGRQMLEKADLILYAGSLVPKELTLCAKAGATVRSSADMNLEEQFAIDERVLCKGLFVVRLHTGDPCIYGAIQEQMNYFDQYGIGLSYHSGYFLFPSRRRRSLFPVHDSGESTNDHPHSWRRTYAHA